MTEVRAGDVILSFCDTRIKAVGVAQGPALSAVKPEFGSIGEQWDDDGWYVPVEFEEAANPIRPKDFIDELKPFLADKYGPLQPNGNGNQNLYLAEVSEPFAKTILTRMDITLNLTLISDEASEADTAEEQAQTAIQGRTDIGATQKAQMVLARRGQGIFRANVRLNEKACRVTGLADKRFLIAGHIKPWRLCNDVEKLDGCNGLLLSPHIDLLFDKGYISFGDDGAILKSAKLPTEVWKHWELTAKDNVGTFNDMQRAYLRFHRAEVFS
jgi:hypothetical protein